MPLLKRLHLHQQFFETFDDFLVIPQAHILKIGRKRKISLEPSRQQNRSHLLDFPVALRRKDGFAVDKQSVADPEEPDHVLQPAVIKFVKERMPLDPHIFQRIENELRGALPRAFKKASYA